MTNLSNIDEIANEIAHLLDTYDLAVPNENATTRLQQLATWLTRLDRESGKAAHKIAIRAEWFYSTRKHANHGGADALYAEMRHELLGLIRSRAEIIDGLRNTNTPASN